MLYHPVEKSFWVFSSFNYIPSESRLVEIGDSWTDVGRMRVAQHDFLMQRKKVWNGAISK